MCFGRLPVRSPASLAGGESASTWRSKSRCVRLRPHLRMNASAMRGSTRGTTTERSAAGTTMSRKMLHSWSAALDGPSEPLRPRVIVSDFTESDRWATCRALNEVGSRPWAMISTDSAGQIAKAVKREGMEEECPVR